MFLPRHYFPGLVSIPRHHHYREWYLRFHHYQGLHVVSSKVDSNTQVITKYESVPNPKVTAMAWHHLEARELWNGISKGTPSALQGYLGTQALGYLDGHLPLYLVDSYQDIGNFVCTGINFDELRFSLTISHTNERLCIRNSMCNDLCK